MQSQLESTLAKLVSIASVTSDPITCREVIDYVRSEFEPLGFFISEGDTNGISPWLMITTQDSKTTDITLAAHLDVVPAPMPLFTLEKSDGKLYGRGVYDMKFAAACYIELAKKHTDFLRTINIGFLFTTDEETGGTSVLHTLEQGWLPNRVFLPDGGDNWAVEERAKGFFGMELTASGKAGHGSRPWEADNALHKLLDICQALRAEYPDKEKTDATLSVNIIKGGYAVNQVADHATASIDFRSFDADECIKFEARVNELAANHDVVVHVKQQGVPLTLDKTNPRVQDFFEALREMDKEVTFCESYGGTDGRLFALYDIPTIIIEPHGGSRHAHDEWLLASDLETYYQLIERWVVPAATRQ